MPRPRLPYVDEATELRRAKSRETYYRRVENGKNQEYLLKKRYGITVLQFDAMMKAQGGRCGICLRLPNGHGRLHVDHDRDSGVVRGLLCFSCNYAIGAFSHDPEILEAAKAWVS